MVFMENIGPGHLGGETHGQDQVREADPDPDPDPDPDHRHGKTTEEEADDNNMMITIEAIQVETRGLRDMMIGGRIVEVVKIVVNHQIGLVSSRSLLTIWGPMLLQITFMRSLAYMAI